MHLGSIRLSAVCLAANFTLFASASLAAQQPQPPSNNASASFDMTLAKPESVVLPCMFSIA